jgi:hypothetical protein
MAGNSMIQNVTGTHDWPNFLTAFARTPGPNDLVFFDPNADTPQPINSDEVETEITRAMDLAGIEPAKFTHTKKPAYSRHPRIGNFSARKTGTRGATL